MNRYTVFVVPGAWKEMKSLPGHMRQRVRRAVDDLGREPRPYRSKELDVPGFEPELHRIRLDRWRIVYAISEQDKAVDVLAVRRRPPYDYGDLEDLIAEMR